MIDTKNKFEVVDDITNELAEMTSVFPDSDYFHILLTLYTQRCLQLMYLYISVPSIF